MLGTVPMDTVLVANRGEIACRVIRTLDRLGIRSVAVHTPVDADAPHVRMAGTAVALEPGGYLDGAQLLDAARRAGATAVHPGYGFLSENAAFAAACAEAGIVFLGPSPSAIETMGDKIRAREAVAARGVPVVPGEARPGLSDDDLAEAVDRIGFPVLIKPSAGGGGKGMHVVRGAGDVRATLRRARREAAAAFGDDTLFLERYVERPRHIEIQVLADTLGTTVALGERECTLQRRHQKVIEEAPAARLDAAVRERMLHDAREAARSVGYVGAGTVEFLVPQDGGDYWFLEMNTRLQVEHPVTELVTGLDLVEEQLRIAAGLPLSFREEDVRITGHAVEARLYAEDPANGFLPSGGRVLEAVLPEGDGVRVDGALERGLVVPPDYDPMLAKVIAWAPDREAAVARLTAALRRTVVLGPATNLPFLLRLLEDPAVRAGDLDTGLIERGQAALTAPLPLPDGAALAALVLTALEERRRPVGAWGDVPRGWRLGEPAAAEIRFAGEEPVRVRGDGDHATVQVGDGAPRPAAMSLDGSAARIRLDGIGRTVHWAVEGGDVHLALDGATARFVGVTAEENAGSAATALPELRSPMPGTVVAVSASDGDRLSAGDPVLVVEAMKMEHTVSSPLAGALELLVQVGDPVARDQVLARIRVDSEDAGSTEEGDAA